MNDCERIVNEYFDWLCYLVDFKHHKSYSELLECLNEREYYSIFPNDDNRVADGIDLRADFTESYNYDLYLTRDVLDGPCTVLEMMVALSIRCEDILHDDKYGDRTALWFWTMVRNLGLEYHDNFHINEDDVDDILTRMLERRYCRDGSHGGLFIVRHPREDLRKVEVWYQMNWYLNEYIEREEINDDEYI